MSTTQSLEPVNTLFTVKGEGKLKSADQIEITLDYLGEITSGLLWERGRQKCQSLRTRCDNRSNKGKVRKRAIVWARHDPSWLALKMETEAMDQGMQVVCRSWESQKVGSFLEPPQGRGCPSISTLDSQHPEPQENTCLLFKPLPFSVICYRSPGNKRREAQGAFLLATQPITSHRPALLLSVSNKPGEGRRKT